MIGTGSPTGNLTDTEVSEICGRGLADLDLDGRRVLAVIPDNTRTAPIDLLYRTVYGLLADRVEALDVLIALGTHPPLDEASIYRRLGITAAEHAAAYRKTSFFNHRWRDPGQLQRVGVIPADELATLSGGRMAEDVEVTVNRLIFDYDLSMVIGPVFPHEVVGFSGGNKYFFPGISGQEIIDAFHWLGALIGSASIIGRTWTPVRRVVDRAAAMLPVDRLCLSLVVGDEGLAGLYVGSPEEAWHAAAELSERIHVRYKERPFRTVLSHVPEMYPDLWTGAKGMYKLEPVVADGGELIIYGPHIGRVSVTHGELIERIGYHVRDYFLAQMDRFTAVPGGVLAHSTHVKGAGGYVDGEERPRIRVILATGIPEETCRRIDLGYRDPATIEIGDFSDREDQGVLYVPNAGERLYRLRDDPFPLEDGG